MDKIMKKQNGITLIALIITIIVMLILVGVAISMAVGENGVIEKGETANSAIEQKSIEETIQTSYYYNKDSAGKLQYKETKEAIDKNLKAAGYTVSVDDGIDFPIKVTVTGKTGTYDFFIKENGIIQNKNKDNEDKLIYGKIYKGMIPDETSATMIETKVVFSKKYNKIIRDNEEVGDFTYNKQEGKVSAFGHTFDLSENGTMLSVSYSGIGTIQLNVTNEEIIYAPQENEDVNVWDGWYYNEDINKFMKVTVDENIEKNIIYIESENSTYGSESVKGLQDALDNLADAYGIFVIDERHMKYDNYVYELLNTLEF